MRWRQASPQAAAEAASGAADVPSAETMIATLESQVAELTDRLLRAHAECTFNWATRDGWPMGVIMSFLWQDGRFWLTAGAHRHHSAAGGPAGHTAAA